MFAGGGGVYTKAIQWVAFVAFVGMVAVLGDQHSRDGQSEGGQVSGRQSEANKSATRVYAETTAVYGERACQNPEQSNYADLCQQWRMANAAEDQRDWTRRGFKLLLGEALVLVLTLIAAGSAAFFARGIIHVTRDSAQIESRAYVGLNGWNKRLVSGEIWEVSARLRNNGATPTKGLVLAIQLDPRPWDFTLRPDWGPPKPMGDDGSYSEVDIGPHDEDRTEWVRISDGELTAIRQERQRLFIWGRVEYYDAFEKTPLRVTGFVVEVVAVDVHARDGTHFDFQVVRHPHNQQT